MAEFLIYLGTGEETDPKGPRRGDPIAVRPGALQGESTWGKKECLGQFLVINLADCTFDEGRALIGNDSEQDLYSRWYFPVEQKLTEQQLAEISASDWIVPEFSISDMVDRTA